MKFEVSDRDHNTGNVGFEGNERNLVNTALHAAIVKAATSGETQLEKSDPIHFLAKILLAPKHVSAQSVSSLRAAHLEALARAVSTSTETIPYDRAQEVGGFIGQLNVAARVLQQNSTMETPSETAIDKIVDQVEIPDSPEGLV